MTRTEAEIKIAEKLFEIRAILNDYEPKGSGHLSMCIIEDYINFFNKYQDDDRDHPLDCTIWGEGD